MDKKSLEAKRTELENSFNNIKEQINNLTSEMYRVQGEHRLLTSQIDELDKETKPAKVAKEQK